MLRTRMVDARRDASRTKRIVVFASALLLCGGAIGLQAQTADTNPVAANATESYRTFYLSSATSQNDASEIQTALRNMVPYAKVYYVPSQGAFAVLANGADMQVAEKVVTDMDRNRKTYRLTYTLTETGAGKATQTQTFTMMVVAGGHTVFKQDIRVPIVTGAADNSAQSSQVQYVDVGLNINASLEGFAQGLRLHSKIEQSSVDGEKFGMGAQDPQIHQVSLDEQSKVVEGKAVSLGSLDIPGSGQHLELSVLTEAIP